MVISSWIINNIKLKKGCKVKTIYEVKRRVLYGLAGVYTIGFFDSKDEAEMLAKYFNKHYSYLNFIGVKISIFEHSLRGQNDFPIIDVQKQYMRDISIL